MFRVYIIWLSNTCSIKYVVGTLLGKNQGSTPFLLGVVSHIMALPFADF